MALAAQGGDRHPRVYEVISASAEIWMVGNRVPHMHRDDFTPLSGRRRSCQGSWNGDRTPDARSWPAADGIAADANQLSSQMPGAGWGKLMMRRFVKVYEAAGATSNMSRD